MVGPSISTLVVAVAKVLGTFQIPVIGLVATANTLSDKTEYPYTMRMEVTDLAVERALLEVIRIRLLSMSVKCVTAHQPNKAIRTRNMDGTQSKSRNL